MTQQLWYTWSTNGYGISTGLRVRAATSELTKVEGPRVRSFIPLLAYTLPDTTDPHLPPSQAPLCLAFLKAKAANTQEPVLIQKTYIGLDYVRRPGNFFSHLLTDLPPVLSPSPAGQLPFSAREAISFWRSPFWRSAEGDWPAGELKLNPIPSEELFSHAYTGPLNGQTVADIASLFKHVFSAFLTLAHQDEGKRLYLVGQPDTIAALIWGITHALPRTLPIMQNLTFSTFEANVETQAKPLIVGTCWQPTYLKQGSEQAILNLPSSYYQPNNPSGIAIHCTTLESTPFTFTIPTPLTPLLPEYLQFVQNCFATGPSGLSTLSLFLTSAEKRNIRDLPSLFHHYVEYHRPLAAEDVTRILQSLSDKASEVSQQIEHVLQEETLSSALTLYVQLGTIQAEVEDFTRENVQLSLLILLFSQPDWWTNQGEKLVQKLYQLSTSPFQEQIALLSNHFVQRILSSKQWQKQQGSDLLTPFAQNKTSDSKELLLAFTRQTEYQLLYLQQDLKKTLLSLGEMLIDQLGQVIRSDQSKDLSFWQRVLSIYLSGTTVWPEIWIHLLKTLSIDMHFNLAYQTWWKGYKQYIRTLRTQAQKLADPQLNSALTSFASSVAQSLFTALQITTTTDPALTFWGDLFQVASPPTSEPIAWAAFLDQLSKLSFTPHYQQWYNHYGKQALDELLTLTRQHTEGSLPQSLETFRISVSTFLLAAVRADQKEPLTFFNALLLQIAPPESVPTPWLKISWPELDSLLSLDLPKNWHLIALASALEIYQSAPTDLVLKTVSHNYTLFEDSLHNLLQKSQPEPTLPFFAFLAQHNYKRKLHLLELLLDACNYQLELSERLLQAAHITSNYEIITLLEQHCQILLSSNELPPTMLQFLERYLTTFDLDRLDNPAAQNLFLRLQQRENFAALHLSDSVRQAVEGWYTIVAFLTQQQGDTPTLRTFTDKLLAMPRLEPATQKKLATKLIPALVPLITTESELILVLYILGQGQELELLQQMAQRAGELFGKTDIPIRIALYVRIILAEGNHLPLEVRDPFVALCFQALFKDIKKVTREKYFPEPLWHRSLMESWEHAMEVHNTFISLKKALNETAYVPDIASLYQPAFEPLLQEDEREIITLARRFITEYDAHNDQAMLQAHEKLRQRYPTSLHYKPEQIQRIQAARQKLSLPASGQMPALPNNNKPISSDFMPLNNGDRYPQNVVHLTNPATQSANSQSPQNTLPPVSTPTPAQVVAEVLSQKILLETLDTTMEVKIIYLQMQLEQKQRNYQLQQIGNSEASEKKVTQREINEIIDLLNDVLKLRQRTLFELINDVFIQQELQELNRDAQHKEWCRQVSIATEQQASSAFETLKKKHTWDQSWNFQDARANEQLKQALHLFIRYEIFQTKYLQETTMEDWTREKHKDVFVDYKVAKILKPRSGLFRR